MIGRERLWPLLGRPLFRCTFHNWYGLRRRVLRSFGAVISDRVKLRRTVDVDRPWNLQVGELTMVGDDVIIRAAEPITIGQRAVISQYTILTTEMRHHDRPGHPTERAAIRIGDDCWIAADTLVMPGSAVGDGTVVGARSLVEGTLPAWSIATGEPAQPRGTRQMRGDA